MGAASSGCPVALVRVLWAHVLCSVIVVVSEVPWLAGLDGVAAAPAGYVARVYLGLPLPALLLVLVAVPALGRRPTLGVRFPLVFSAVAGGCWAGTFLLGTYTFGSWHDGHPPSAMRSHVYPP